VPVYHGIAWVNGLWTILLFGIVVWKLQSLRRSVENLASEMTHEESQFLRREMGELKEDMHHVRACMTLLEQRLTAGDGPAGDGPAGDGPAGAAPDGPPL
jgi:hypothetical protein